MTSVIDNETQQTLNLISSGKDVLLALFKAGHELCVLFSGGKDSSCIALLVLLAAKDAVAAGYTPKVMVTTGATLVENPEVDIYAAAESMSCAVVADMISSGKKRAGCGARTGCFCCTQSDDQSLENMVQYDPRYSYASGLVKFNKFLRAIRYDWGRRHYLGRTVRGGYIALQPDTFHPATLRELFRIMLTLDFDERNRANSVGEEPMFQMLTAQMIVAIDAYWSLSGFAAPYAAWADYRDIFVRGIRYGIPDVSPSPKSELPAARFLPVGCEWDDEQTAQWSGMRDAYTESLTADTSCGSSLREMSDGRVVWDLDTHGAFNVNEESAEMIMCFEASRLAKKYDAGFQPGNITAAYKFYLQYGALELTGAQLSEHDHILRRTAFKDALGLSIDYDVHSLLARSIDFASMPEDGRVAWAHKEVVNQPVSQKISPKVILITPVATIPASKRKQGWQQTDLFGEKIAA